MEEVVFCSIDVPAKGQVGDLEVKGGGQQHVSAGKVSVDKAVVGEVLHAQSYLMTHGDLLAEGEGRELNITLAVVLTSGPEELLEVTLEM